MAIAKIIRSQAPNALMPIYDISYPATVLLLIASSQRGSPRGTSQNGCKNRNEGELICKLSC